MKSNILLFLTAMLFLGGSMLNGASLNSKDTQGQLDKSSSSYYGFYAKPAKLTKKELEYYNKTGLISKHQMIQDDLKLVAKNTVKPAQEILDGLKNTFKAISLLKKHDVKSAKIALTSATTQFDIALKKDPSLKLVPVNMQTTFDDSPLTLANVKSIKKNALRMVNNNQPQEAVMLLSQLKNQITITTTNLPMDLYPIAVKHALNALNKGKKIDIALPLLTDALNTMVVTEIVIPMPILISQSALKDAQKLSKNDKNDKTEITKLLNLSKRQLEVAKYEGYLSKYNAEYKNISEEIDRLKNKISKGTLLVKDYDKVKSDFVSLFQKIHQGKKK